MRTTTPGIRAGVAATALLVALTGCTASASAAPATPTPSANQVVLTLTMYDDKDTPGADLVSLFVTAANALDRTVTISPHYAEAKDETTAVNAVSSGTSDLAMVASRAFDNVGVTTLQALNTPFLIDSDALAKALATGPQVPALFAGLKDINVIGLAMAPEGLRHPFGAVSAPVAVGDLAGQPVRSPQSQAVWSMLSTLGAKPMYADSGYTAAESEFDQSPADHAAGNVTFFAKFDVLALSAAASKRLSAAQLTALRQAATKATTEFTANEESDASKAKDFCVAGGSVALASDAQLAAWKAAVQPAIAKLRSVASTARLIDAIGGVKAGLPAAPAVNPCPGP